ncbi:MAG: hypothetical protein J0H55_00745 [Chitinophagaceae bacterium]|nr:hypothetical protein [Chitinophagaceae bacterium]
MQNIEPYDNWQYLYTSEEDERSPFYGREYSEFEFSNTIYNYYIHPLWDEFGSRTLYLKVLMADYDSGYMIMELIGEWNDAIENDIMTLKREVVDLFIQSGISKFILIVENVLNFHSSDDCYYQEWFEDVNENEGWIALVNMPDATQYDFLNARLDNYIPLLQIENWRTMRPDFLFQQVDNLFVKKLNG